ncbi:MAG: hypothetical protein Q9178_000299 [Gyalolechia marmorata]
MKSLINHAVAAYLAGTATVVHAAASTAAECCDLLEKSFPGKTYSGSDQQNLYQAFVSSYWSVNVRLTPNCAVSPANTKDVAAIVGLLSKNSCQFAVKSGGHGLVQGASNIAKGVTIDLGRMTEVSLNRQTKIATVQPGAKWADVYSYLGTFGYAVPGGRAGNVGVGGLTSGGGNSFFAARYGFTCDNVKLFEVILGNGTIVQADNVTNTDLFTALKGSQNNLGIITRFDFIAFEQTDLWGGTAVYGQKTVPAQIKAFYEFTRNLRNDPFGSLIFLWSYIPTVPDEAQRLTFVNLYEYTANLTGPVLTYPPPFKGFAPDSPVGPPIVDTLRVANLSNLTAELNAPPELRNLFETLTFTNDLKVLNEVVGILKKELDYSKTDAFYAYASVQFQPLPRLFTEKSIASGGNVLGLDRYQDDNVIFLLDLAWGDAQFDAKARSLADRVMGNLTTYLQEARALKDFQYLNCREILSLCSSQQESKIPALTWMIDASESQDPLGGYGPAALAKIKAASKKYDAGQVFQKLVPGGFKLAGAGSGTEYDD